MTATIALPRQPHSDWLARLRTIMVLRPGQRVVHLPGLGVRTSRRAVSSGETVLFYDTFTDSNGVQLQNHTPDVGSAWTADAAWTISSNRAVNSNYVAYARVNVGASDYDLSFLVRLQNASSIIPRGAIVRWDSVYDFYSVGIKYEGHRFGIFANSYSNYSAFADTAFTVTANTDYTIAVRCSGSTITATINGGNEVSYASAATSRNVIGLITRWAADQIDDVRVVAL